MPGIMYVCLQKSPQRVFSSVLAVSIICDFDKYVMTTYTNGEKEHHLHQQQQQQPLGGLRISNCAHVRESHHLLLLLLR